MLINSRQLEFALLTKRDSACTFETQRQEQNVRYKKDTAEYFVVMVTPWLKTRHPDINPFVKSPLAIIFY